VKTLLCLTLFAQMQPWMPVQQQPKVNSNDPHARRQWREDAVAHVGQDARPMVETHELAARALLACSYSTANDLVAAFNRGDLSKLPSLDYLLAAIVRSNDGEAVAVFAIGHLKELEDIDHFNAFMGNPVEYALGLKDLAAGAAEVRAARLRRQAWATPLGDGRMVLFWGVVLAGIGFLIRRRLRRSDEESMVV